MDFEVVLIDGTKMLFSGSVEHIGEDGKVINTYVGDGMLLSVLSAIDDIKSEYNTDYELKYSEDRLSVDVYEGKYTPLYNIKTKTFTSLRYGEEWGANYQITDRGKIVAIVTLLSILDVRNTKEIEDLVALYSTQKYEG